MFAVFGKSLKHEQVKKGSFLSSPEYRFAKKEALIKSRQPTHQLRWRKNL